MPTLIMPCAGKSTRFGLSKPKYLLTHPHGRLMFMEALAGLDTHLVDKVIITVVRNHIEGVDLQKIIDEISYLNVEFLILDQFTSSQSETIYLTLKEKNVEGSFFIKDCDNYFRTTVDNQNAVCVAYLRGDINATNKSYVSLNKYGNISGIIEKTIIGDRFCVGGYSFQDSQKFITTYEKLINLTSISQKEIYVSHIIQELILSGEEFHIKEVENYLDWGTWEDWQKYTNSFATIFIDLDGVLVENGAEYMEPKWGMSEGLANNIKKIKELYNSDKAHIVLTTSRKEKYREITLKQLNILGVMYHQVIFGLPHAKRILINDYSASNPYPSATAININRNNDNLDKLLKL